jgi:hypothetical protein
MARTLIPKVVSAYQSKTLLQTNSSAVAVDSVNGMYFVNPKNQVTVFYVINSSAMTSTNVTVTSIVDKAGRGNSSCDNVTAKTVAVGETWMFGPFTAVWWNQPDGVVNVDFSATNASIKVLAVQIA